MKSFFLWLAKSIDETPGEPSAMRLVVVVGMLAIISVWTAACAWNHAILEIPGSVLGFSGTLLTAKFVQKFSEGKTP